MRTRTAYRIHRWIAIFFGLVLLNQVISGAVMILPQPEGTAPGGPPTIDYHALTLSPAAALEALARETGDGVRARPVEAMSLRSILGRIHYEVSLEGGGTHLIDIESGEKKAITSEIAGEIGRSAVASTSPIHRVERLDRHDYRWRHGELPVYRITLQDAAASVVYVSATTGAVGGKSTRWGRIRTLVASLHVAEPVGWLLGSDRARKAALHLFALAGLATAMTGFFLALPRQRRSSDRPAVPDRV